MKKTRKGAQAPSIDELLSMPLKPEYKLRFITKEESYKLVNLYHLARTALSGKEDTPYHRMIWACSEFSKINPSISEKEAYKDLCGLLDR